MNTVETIKECVYNVQRMEEIDLNEAFDKFLNYCLVEVGIQQALFKAKLPTSIYLHDNFKINLLIGEDYLGDAYLNLNLPNSKSVKEKLNRDSLTHKVDESIKIINSIKEKGIYSIFLNNVGSGKILFILHKRKPGLMMYTNEIDKTLYKIALFNISLNNLPVKITYNMQEPLNSTPASEDWIYSNMCNFY